MDVYFFVHTQKMFQDPGDCIIFSHLSKEKAGIFHGGCLLPDQISVYTITDFELRPTRLGSHSELFD